MVPEPGLESGHSRALSSVRALSSSQGCPPETLIIGVWNEVKFTVKYPPMDGSTQAGDLSPAWWRQRH